MSRSDRNWTIVSILHRDPVPVDDLHPFGWRSRCERYVVDTPFKVEAEKIVEAWLDEDPSRAENLSKIYYYPRTYVDLERSCRSAGRIIK